MMNVSQGQHETKARFTDAARFAALARARLSLAIAGVVPGHASPSDFDLNPDVETPALVSLKPAAVLVAVSARDPLTVLLTQRTETLTHHPGQIAFPGGRIDADDATPADGALREAYEEIGLASDLVQPLGYLDTYRTGTGYAITPLVGLVAPGFTLALQPLEVAEAFEVPLAFLMDGANHRTHTKVWQGTARRFYAMPYENRYIWGATAGILKNMHERLFGS